MYLNAESQDIALTYMDELPARTAVIGTSNLKINALHERFQTRFQHFMLKAPDEHGLAALLARFGLDKRTIGQIVVGCGTNVRAALLDAQTILDARSL